MANLFKKAKEAAAPATAKGKEKMLLNKFIINW